MGGTKRILEEQQDAEAAIARSIEEQEAMEYAAEADAAFDAQERAKAESAEDRVKLQAKIEAREVITKYDLNNLTRKALIFLCLDSLERTKFLEGEAQKWSNRLMSMKARNYRNK